MFVNQKSTVSLGLTVMVSIMTSSTSSIRNLKLQGGHVKTLFAPGTNPRALEVEKL